MLPALMECLQTLVHEGPANQRREVLRLECSASVAAAKLETKAGNGVAALASAHRARRAALKADDPFGQAAASYQLACALLKLGQREEAELTAVQCASSIPGTDPESLTWRGALTLISSIIAARRMTAPRPTAALTTPRSLPNASALTATSAGPLSARRMSASTACRRPSPLPTRAQRWPLPNRSTWCRCRATCVGARRDTTSTVRGHTTNSTKIYPP